MSSEIVIHEESKLYRLLEDYRSAVEYTSQAMKEWISRVGPVEGGSKKLLNVWYRGEDIVDVYKCLIMGWNPYEREPLYSESKNRKV